ncbi:hypothetical protein BLA29_010326 [Euroglyphus maynei]|uniref:DUF4187 domain-containing protein n=1 Tax=Euroglyphus maynei TaxID=6958 RepID=A0A1Y3AQF6_EURMA|nr:hypothetical protein BLA29_010326 [Euroglyphus maynei]
MERRPIDIEFRTGRQGLGHDSYVKQKQHKRQKFESTINSMDPDKFLRYQMEKSEQLLARKDYYSLQKICYNLDQTEGMNEPDVEWHWPKSFLRALRSAKIDQEDGEQSDDDEDDEIDYQKQLQQLDDYVRKKYFYCIWCGCRYDCRENIEQNCPGNSRQLH